MIILALFGAGCDIVASVTKEGVWQEDRRFAVAGRPTLDLQTFDGSIEVRAGTASEVRVTIERRATTEAAARALEVSVQQDGNRIVVRAAKSREPSAWGRSGSVSFVVSTPAESDVEARSGDGSIRIEGVRGALTSHTGDGSIRLAEVNGPIDVSSGDGSIGVAGRIARLHARSGDGSVRVEAAAGSTTGDGWDVGSGDGSVTIALPADFGAELDAHTGDGGIHVDGITVSDVTGEARRNTLRGRLGSGGGQLRVRTGSGSITLTR